MEFLAGWLSRRCPFFSFFSLSVVGCVVVDWGFFLVLSWWPSAADIEWDRILRTLLSVMNVHVDISLFLMAFRSVLFVRLPRDWCRKVRVAFMVPSGITTLICGSSFGVDFFCWGLDTLGNIHSLVAGSLYPLKVLRPPFYTCKFYFVNVTLHPMPHSTEIETRGSYIFLNLYAFFALSGSPSVFIWHWICASILFPYGSCELIGFICLS